MRAAAGWLFACTALLGSAMASDDVLIYRCTDAHGHETYQDVACPINSFEHVIRMQRPVAPPPPRKAPTKAAADAKSATAQHEAASTQPDAGAASKPTFSLPPWETAIDPATQPGAAAAAAAVTADKPPRPELPAPGVASSASATEPDSAPTASDAAAAKRLRDLAKERGFSLPPWETEAMTTPAAAASVDAEAVTLRPGPRSSPPPLWRCRGLDRKAYISDTATPPPKCIALTELGVNLDGLPKDQRGGCRDVHDACDRIDDAAACAHYAELRSQAELGLGTQPLAAAAAQRAEFSRLDRIWKASCERP